MSFIRFITAVSEAAFVLIKDTGKLSLCLIKRKDKTFQRLHADLVSFSTQSALSDCAALTDVDTNCKNNGVNNR